MTSSFLAVLALTASAACGGGGGPPPAPLPAIEGGGAAGGPIDGVLSVWAIDAEDGSPIAGARVLAGGGEATTGADGLATLEEGALVGPTDVTVIASGYPATAFLGVAARVVTVPLLRAVRDEVTVSVTLQGFETLPEPAPFHFLTAVADTSRRDLLDMLDGLPPVPVIPAAAPCGRSPGEPAAPCTIDITVPAGEVTIVATFLSVEEETGAATAVGFGLARDVIASEGASLMVPRLPDSSALGVDLETPGDTAGVIGVPGLNLGEDGVLLFPVRLTTADDQVLLPVVPDAGSQWLVAEAAATTGDARSIALDRSPEAGGLSVAGGDFLGFATIALAGGTLSITRPAGAGLVRVEARDAGGALAFRAFVLDGRASVETPAGAAAAAASIVATDVAIDPTGFQLVELLDGLGAFAVDSTP